MCVDKYYLQLQCMQIDKKFIIHWKQSIAEFWLVPEKEWSVEHIPTRTTH